MRVSASAGFMYETKLDAGDRGWEGERQNLCRWTSKLSLRIMRVANHLAGSRAVGAGTIRQSDWLKLPDLLSVGT